MSSAYSMDAKFVDLTIHGYMRQEFIVYTPDIIISIIKLFYNQNMPFNVYDSESKLLTNNINGITKMYINRLSILLVTDVNDLYYFGDNLDDQLPGIKPQGIGKSPYFNECNNKIQVISQGTSNKICYIYTDNNILYSTNKLIDHGTNYQEYNESLHIINNLPFQSKLVSIEASCYHVLFLTINGDLFGCGQNNRQQLSFPNDGIHPTLFTNIVKLKDITNIKQIGCCYLSSIVLNNNGDIISFGSNDFSELGVPKRERINTISLKNETIIKIDSGCHSSGFLTNKYNVYMFGCNDDGECGRNKIHKRTESPLKINVNSEEIIDFKCGGYHSIVKTINNEYYSYGTNRNNACLINTKNDHIWLPTKINLTDIHTKIGNNKTIIDIIPGYNISFIIQQNFNPFL